MKQLSLWRNLFFLFIFLLVTFSLNAQEVTVTGKVTDASNGMELPGATVVIKGTSRGTATNSDGEYQINVNSGDVLVFSYIGYLNKEFSFSGQTVINVSLEPHAIGVKELVVIGYGTVSKEDATGSVTAINTDNFNKGAITSPQELVTGKIAGVQITSGGGAPGTGATIRIRGGSSLSASNDPLFVIDGIPVDNDGISGMRNPLNTIHPNDIETFTVLKDASATAIYGSRASNGVIIITTKKGKKNRPFTVNYNGYMSVGTRSGEVDILSADEYRSLLQEQFGSNQNAIDLLGTANTNWQDEIFRTSISHDHKINATGSVKDLPFRASIGYSDQNGILKTSGLNRTTGSLNVSPSFLDDHLKINLNAKGMYIQNDFAIREL